MGALRGKKKKKNLADLNGFLSCVYDLGRSKEKSIYQDNLSSFSQQWYGIDYIIKGLKFITCSDSAVANYKCS